MFGGNKAFYSYLQEYEGLAGWPVDRKYKSEQAAWYARRMAAHLDQRVFAEKQPAKDWDERFERAKQSMKSLIATKDKPKDTPPAPKEPDNKSPKEDSAKEAATEETKEAPKEAPKEAGKDKVKEWNSKIKGFFKDKFSKKPSAAKEEKPPADLQEAP